MARSRIQYSGRLYTDRHTFQIAGQTLDQQAIRTVNEVAEMYRDSILTVIELGGPGWDLNTVYYRRKKAQMGFGNTPYVKTGALLQSLTVEANHNARKRHRAWAGFKDGDHYSGYSISELVDILDANRPLISPAWERIEGQANSMLSTIGQGILR